MHAAVDASSPAPQSPPYRDLPAPPPRRPVTHPPLRPKELAAWLTIALIVDVGTWDGETSVVGGLGLALVHAAVPLVVALSVARFRWTRRLVVLGAVLGLLALRMAILPADSTNLAALGCIAALPIVLRQRRASPLEVGATFFTAIVAIPSRLSALIGGLRTLAPRSLVTSGRLVATFVPFALALAFVLVFALANPLVAEGLAWVGDALASLTWPAPVRVLLFCSALGAGIFLLRPSPLLARDDEGASHDGEVSELSRMVARNSLIAVCVVFLGYLVLDAIHLVSGRPPEGMTTQIYAHQGAFWLTVALAMLTATVGVLFRGALAHDPASHGVRRLAYLWTGLGVGIALATYARLGIHIERSGLSDLRIVGILGITSVVIGMLLTARKLARGRSFLWLVRRQLDVLAAVVALYALLPTHFISAHVNVARIEAGANGALLHVGPEVRQTESCLVYLPLLDHPDPVVRRGVAATLLRKSEWTDAWLEANPSWRDRELVTEHVASALRQARPRILAALDGAEPLEAERALAELGERAALDRPSAVFDAVGADESSSGGIGWRDGDESSSGVIQ